MFIVYTTSWAFQWYQVQVLHLHFHFQIPVGIKQCKFHVWKTCTHSSIWVLGTTVLHLQLNVMCILALTTYAVPRGSLPLSLHCALVIAIQQQVKCNAPQQYIPCIHAWTHVQLVSHGLTLYNGRTLSYFSCPNISVTQRVQQVAPCWKTFSWDDFTSWIFIWLTACSWHHHMKQKLWCIYHGAPVGSCMSGRKGSLIHSSAYYICSGHAPSVLHPSLSCLQYIDLSTAAGDTIYHIGLFYQR